MKVRQDRTRRSSDNSKWAILLSMLACPQRRFARTSSPRLIEMVGQFRNATVIVIKKRDELIAFFQRQPHAGDTEVHQHRLSCIRANAEIDFQRLLTAMIVRISQHRHDDDILRRSFCRPRDGQGLPRVSREIRLIAGYGIVLEGGNKSILVCQGGGAAILAEGEERNALHVDDAQKQVLELSATLLWPQFLSVEDFKASLNVIRDERFGGSCCLCSRDRSHSERR